MSSDLDSPHSLTVIQALVTSISPSISVYWCVQPSCLLSSWKTFKIGEDWLITCQRTCHIIVSVPVFFCLAYYQCQPVIPLKVRASIWWLWATFALLLTPLFPYKHCAWPSGYTPSLFLSLLFWNEEHRNSTGNPHLPKVTEKPLGLKGTEAIHRSFRHLYGLPCFLWCFGGCFLTAHYGLCCM